MRHKWTKKTGKARCLNCGARRNKSFIPTQYVDSFGKPYMAGYAPPCFPGILNSEIASDDQG